MRKIMLVYLILPMMSSFASAKEKQTTPKVELKSAQIVSVSAGCAGETHLGKCYLFDDSGASIKLQDPIYSFDKENLIVDIKVNAEDQKKLYSLSKRYAGKRHVVFMVNGEIVSSPFLKTMLNTGDFQISLKDGKEFDDLKNALQKVE